MRGIKYYKINVISIFVTLILSVMFTPMLKAEPLQRDDGWIEVGRGEMDWLWFSLYKARLLSVTGQYQPDQYPIMLDIEYYRDIAAEDLLEATRDQWQALKFADKDIQRWLGLLTSAWPDVKQGDRLGFKVISQQQSQFFYNSKPLDMINDANFANSFLAIWLSEKTTRPELRAQLLGDKPCNC